MNRKLNVGQYVCYDVHTLEKQLIAIRKNSDYIDEVYKSSIRDDVDCIGYDKGEQIDSAVAIDKIMDIFSTYYKKRHFGPKHTNIQINGVHVYELYLDMTMGDLYYSYLSRLEDNSDILRIRATHSVEIGLESKLLKDISVSAVKAESIFDKALLRRVFMSYRDSLRSKRATMFKELSKLNKDFDLGYQFEELDTVYDDLYDYCESFIRRG